ncbi:hypothetical protein GCM10009836_54000 [Pseudonocardia ailaonensis]|uniref:DUF4232 domain-containing protein n=1 Tax=Pseudonocardia ailaonensis TaxID=367279 RepID=A0ABN2NHC8_9PSEU
MALRRLAVLVPTLVLSLVATVSACGSGGGPGTAPAAGVTSASAPSPSRTPASTTARSGSSSSARASAAPSASARASATQSSSCRKADYVPLRAVTLTNSGGDTVRIWRSGSSTRPYRPYWKINGGKETFQDTLPYTLRAGSLTAEFFVVQTPRFEPGSDGRNQLVQGYQLVMEVCGTWRQTDGPTDIWKR